MKNLLKIWERLQFDQKIRLSENILTGLFIYCMDQLLFRPLPTRESEWEHRNDPIWEFGFYEPPEDKIPKGKLIFREALEVIYRFLEQTFRSCVRSKKWM